jgi:hypothetical protein
MEQKRQPTADEIAGLQWWNALTEPERAKALEAAGWKSGSKWTPSAADAWALHKVSKELAQSAAKRYVVIIIGNGIEPYVFDTETRTKIMSYPTVSQAEHQAKLLNSFLRPAPPGNR